MKKLNTICNHNGNRRSILPQDWGKMRLPYYPKLARYLNVDLENP